ncbi:hypothetical protein V6N11_082278 [Hibiscus sabdariffa]|uniref:F-box domain-containing protein n=1 Tax=Hibiscus sabdariffa TaxID=183260 RepID=A0ABR1ZES5_9ROSI
MSPFSDHTLMMLNQWRGLSLLVALPSYRGVEMKLLITLPVLVRNRLLRSSRSKKSLPKFLIWFKQTVAARILHDFFHQKDHGVPHDLIEDILVKLPVKSLVRFKYVSQQWFRLITDRHLSNQCKKGPVFVTASARFVHPNFGPRKYIFLSSMVVNGDTNTIPPAYIRIVDVPEEYWYDMLNSCDGILCFRGAFNIWVHNPATKDHTDFYPRV